MRVPGNLIRGEIADAELQTTLKVNAQSIIKKLRVRTKSKKRPVVQIFSNDWIPPVSLVEAASKMIRQTKETTSLHVVNIGGKYFDRDSLLECRQIIQYRKIQEDVRTESSWKNKVKLGISKPSDLKSPLNYYALAESLTSFISNHHAGDIIQGLELDIEALSSLCHERWVFTELTSAFCNILNKQSSSSSISIDLSSIAI